MPTPASHTKLLLPNDPMGVPVRDDGARITGWVDATVIASVVFNDDDPRHISQTLLLMHREPPYFQVAIYDPPFGMAGAHLSERIGNIVPAVALYEDWGGDY